MEVMIFCFAIVVRTVIVDYNCPMVYDLNSKLRDPWPHGSWDTTNAEELLKYTISKGYDVSWELGNGMFMQYCNHCLRYIIDFE